MKKLHKRNYLLNDTVEAFACNCICGTCKNTEFRLDHRASMKQFKLESEP